MISGSVLLINDNSSSHRESRIRLAATELILIRGGSGPSSLLCIFCRPSRVALPLDLGPLMDVDRPAAHRGWCSSQRTSMAEWFSRVPSPSLLPVLLHSSQVIRSNSGFAILRALDPVATSDCPNGSSSFAMLFRMRSIACAVSRNPFTASCENSPPVLRRISSMILILLLLETCKFATRGSDALVSGSALASLLTALAQAIIHVRSHCRLGLARLTFSVVLSPCFCWGASEAESRMAMLSSPTTSGWEFLGGIVLLAVMSTVSADTGLCVEAISRPDSQYYTFKWVLTVESLNRGARPL